MWGGGHKIILDFMGLTPTYNPGTAAAERQICLECTFCPAYTQIVSMLFSCIGLEQFEIREGLFTRLLTKSQILSFSHGSVCHGFNSLFLFFGQ